MQDVGGEMKCYQTLELCVGYGLSLISLECFLYCPTDEGQVPVEYCCWEGGGYYWKDG